MQLNKKSVIKIDGNKIKWSEINDKSYKASAHSNFKELNSDKILKRNSVYILIENEEIYTRLITVPKFRKWRLYNIIENEIKYYFNNNSNMSYNYSVLYSDKNKTKVIVACINTNNIDSLKKKLIKCRIISLNLIQICFLDYFKKYINDNSFIFLFAYNSSLYVLGCIENVIISNNIIKNIDFNNMDADIIKDFLINCRDIYMEYEFSSIYYANISMNNIINIDNFEARYIDLGALSNEVLLNYFIYGRRCNEQI